MKKFLCAVVPVALFTLPALCQYGKIDSSKLPQIGAHYVEELALDMPSDEQLWSKESNGLHAAFGSPDELYLRREVPSAHISKNFSITGWKGERLNAQVIIWSPDTINQVRLLVHDLINEKGNIIEATNISLNLVRYVLSNYPYGARDAVCGNSPYNDGYLMPDRFEAFERFEVPGKSVRPVWISINVPATAAAGIYKGVIDVVSEKDKDQLNVVVKVQNKTLPPPSQWTYRLDLWQNPWAVAEYNHVKPWSEEHKALLKKHLQLYADMGGKYITTYGVHSPWADNEFQIEGGMIEWIKRKNGGWSFDYKIFDEYVELCMKYGINKAITIYTPLPWAERFRYLSEETGNYVYEQWLPETNEYKKNWNAFLTDLKKHLEKKGWMKITYIGINENAMHQTLAAIKVVKSHSPQWRITYAGDWHPELDTLLDDYSFLYGKEPTVEQQSKRRKRGASSTFYVCCNPPYPNNFLFSPPIEGRWLSWYAAAYGYNGFLRWAYDAWPEDPSRDGRHGSWAAGDCFLVYPGGNSCIRYEKLCEGIVDFEKIRILRQEASAKKDTWKKFDDHLKVFTTEKEFDSKKITADVEKGKQFIEELSEK
jgi:hypothetical protein